MDNIIFFLILVGWIMNPVLLVLVGVLIGVVGVSLAPWAYRLHRRRVLHRRWRDDRPQRIVESLTPQWEDYDPDLIGVDRRCVCHRRSLHPGERVLLWPETGPLGVLHVAAYCETVKERI
jgi:hypothetical protein